MADKEVDGKDMFMAWLSGKVSATQLSEFYMALHEIEKQARKASVIHKSIYENFNLAQIKKVRNCIEQSRFFKLTHRRQMGRITSALDYLIQYTTEVEAPNNVNGKKPTSMLHCDEKIIADSTFQTQDSISEKNEKVLSIDFTDIGNIAHTKPFEVIYRDVMYSVGSWKDAFVKTCECLLAEYPDEFEQFKIDCLNSTNNFWITDSANSNRLRSKKIIDTNYFVETNASAHKLMKNLKWILDACQVGYENVIIHFYVKGDTEPLNTSQVTAYASKEPYRKNTKEDFFDWLQNKQGLAEATCRSYVSAVRGAEKFAAEHGFEHKNFFSSDTQGTIALVDELFHNAEFVAMNDSQHNRFRAAITKFLLFNDTTYSFQQFSSAKYDKNKISVEHSKKIIGSSQPQADPKIKGVLETHYEYGFKYESIRELMRFRQFADAMGVELPEADNDLKDAILASGIVIDDKVYCKDDDMPLELQRVIDNIFSSGVGVIYYESLFENKSEWMENHVIASPDILKEYLQKNVGGCSFSKKFMVKENRRSEKDAVTNELKRVWGTSPLVNVHDLHDRLPYIPLENIWRVISGNDLFVLVSEDKYFYMDCFVITGDEEKNILNYVEMTCAENGYASLNDVPIGNIEEENYELTQPAIYNAIYKKVLSGKYHLNGKILTKEKSDLDVVALLKLYIKEKDECTFDEVANKVVELTGCINRQYAFLALYDDMVRVDKNRFVANRFVDFNVEEIDAVLSGFITNNFRAIRDVTTFAMFPICGQNWNHYLLESFCYKYSRKYSLHVIHFNDKNAGIIAKKEYNKTYNEMLAIAVSRSDVELVPDVIGRYLFNSGYMAKSKYAKLNEIAQQASELRKGM